MSAGWSNSPMMDTVNPHAPPSDATLVGVCNVEDIPLGLGRAFHIGGRTLALFRTRAGRVFAVENRCPHRGGPLSEGMLTGEAVVCPLHAFRFELATGACDSADTCPIRTYAIVQEEDQILVTLPPSDD